MSELKEKSTEDLVELVAEKRAELRKVRFGAAGSGMRNTRGARTLRREIAQALTELTTRSKSEA